MEEGGRVCVCRRSCRTLDPRPPVVPVRRIGRVGCAMILRMWEQLDDAWTYTYGLLIYMGMGRSLYGISILYTCIMARSVPLSLSIQQRHMFFRNRKEVESWPEVAEPPTTQALFSTSSASETTSLPDSR